MIKFNISTRNIQPRLAYRNDLFSVVAAPHISVAESSWLGFQLWDAALEKEIRADNRDHRSTYWSSETIRIDAVRSPLAFAKYKRLRALENETTPIPIFPDFRGIVPEVQKFRGNGTLFNFTNVSTNNTKIDDWLSTAQNSTIPELLWFDLPADWPERTSIGAVAMMPAYDEEYWTAY